MAARDRFGGFGEPATTPLQRYIMQACDPQNYEPNLALNLEIADVINAKKGNAPREAAVTIVNYINHRNPNVSLLALNLLDICVKNCGYPFHLQISTKEFLNELVRRFPERPPVRETRVQLKVLELIEEWRQTICQTSRYKEDLGYIRDMHRLLSYKGYTFPAVKREDAAVLNPSDNLRSAEEMEQEERAAQSAKLQELIRRGTPHDLQEANRLMKVMAGYDTRHKTDYRAKAAEEVSKIQQKAKLLEEMLQKHEAGDEIKEGDVFEELANALASAQPKIQKMCEEESDDHEAVAKLFEINDSIHRTLERYKLIKKGDLEGASRIPQGTLGTSGAGVSRGPDNELSLIDLGGPEELSTAGPTGTSTSTEAPSAPKGNALEDDLLGLSMGDDTFGQGGGISLGSTNGFNTSGSSGSLPVMGARTAPESSTPTIQQVSSPSQALSAKANYDPFGSLSTQSTSQAGVISPAISSQSLKPSHRPADPFAALSSHAPRQGSPFQFQQSIKPPTSPSAGLLDLARPTSQSPPPAPSRHNNITATDDEWTFASALPDQPHTLTVTNTSVHIQFRVSRQGNDVILINSSISNNTPKLISELTFQIAVTKGYTLKLEAQSGRNLAPLQKEGITQTIHLHGVERGKGSAVKMRWKASYLAGTERRDEQGEIPSLGMA